MKPNNKSAIKIYQSLIIIALVLITGTTSQVYKNTKNHAKTQENSEQVIEIAQTEINRGDTTSRSDVDRSQVVTTEETAEVEEIVEEVEETKYISIEEVEISKNMDLTERCGLSKEDFKTLIGGVKQDTTKFFYDNSDTIYDLCEEYEINEIFFCGLMAGESGWNIASNHRKTHNYISMMSNGKLIQYSSVEDGLEAAAKLLHNKYLTEGGSCYSGKTLYGVQKRFCPGSSTWVNLIYTCMSHIV